MQKFILKFAVIGSQDKSEKFKFNDFLSKVHASNSGVVAYETVIEINNYIGKLEILDIDCSTRFKLMRQLYYRSIHYVLLLLSLDNPDLSLYKELIQENSRKTANIKGRTVIVYHQGNPSIDASVIREQINNIDADFIEVNINENVNFTLLLKDIVEKIYDQIIRA